MDGQRVTLCCDGSDCKSTDYNGNLYFHSFLTFLA